MLALDAAVLLVVAAVVAGSVIVADPRAQAARARDLERLRRAINELFSNNSPTGVNECPLSPIALSQSAPTPSDESVTPEEKEALDRLGPIEGLTPEEIEAKLKDQGFAGPAKAKSGGKVFTKDVGNGRTIGVRLDPAEATGPGTRRPEAKGWADEKPHSHKESVPSSEVHDGNYDPRAKEKLIFDDAGKVRNPKAASDKDATHIPMNGNL